MSFVDRALENQQTREKLGFTSGVGRAMAQAVEKNPFWTLAGVGTAGGLLGGAMKGGAGAVACI